jgi:hypothetical protein
MSHRLLQKVIRNATVRGKPYNVLVQLAIAANDKGVVRLSVAELRRRTRSTDDTSLYKAIRQLARHGYVQQWGRPFTKEAYLIVSERALIRAAIVHPDFPKISATRQRDVLRREQAAMRRFARGCVKEFIERSTAKNRIKHT